MKLEWSPKGKRDDIVYVYTMTNTYNDKKYVGVSYNPPQRWLYHLQAESIIGHALRKYGFENFENRVVFVGTRREALKIEGDISRHENTIAPFGYNQIAGGIGSWICSDVTRKKMSESQKNKKLSEETKAKISKSNKGRKLTDEARKKMSVAQTGRVVSDEARKNISEAAKKRPRKTYSDESKARMSAAQKGRVISEETRKKISATTMGHKRSEESIKKQIETRKRRKEMSLTHIK